MTNTVKKQTKKNATVEDGIVFDYNWLLDTEDWLIAAQIKL